MATGKGVQAIPGCSTWGSPSGCLASGGLPDLPRLAGSGLTCIRAVQITRFGGPEVMDVVDLPDPTPGEGQQLYEVRSSGVNFAFTHHRPSAD